MKWVAAALAVLNLGMLLWGTYHQPPAVPAALLPRGDIRAGELQPLVRERAAPDPRSGSVNAAAQAQACWTVGPFLTREAAGLGSAELARLDIAHQTRSGRDAVIEGFRVLVGPLRGPEDTQAMRRRLVELGLNDHYVIRSEADTAIALGFFSSQDGARSYAEELAARGIEAYLKPRALENAQVYWLDLAGPGLAPAARKALEAVEWASPPARLRARTCGAG